MHSLTLTRPSEIINNALAKRSKIIPATAVGILGLVWALPALAAGDVTSMQVMANSYEMQGTTDFYYNNEWLVKFVQFAISWLCILALLCYYAGWLCSMVVLSNKELFYLIDTIKKEASEGADSGDKKGFSAFTSVMHTFKNGSKDGVNGGLDNLVLFVLSLSINFKAYSHYKDVEAGSDGEGGNGFSYNDTMLNFILKTAINAIAVTFVTSVAISGVLLQCWFTISDVFAVRAERFAQTNLSAKIDEWLGTAGGYEFTIGTAGTHGATMAEEIAKKMYGATAGQFPNATSQQLQSIGVATENRVTQEIFGGPNATQDYYGALQKLVAASVTKEQMDKVKITNETQAKLAGFQFDVNTNAVSAAPGSISIPMKDILDNAGVSVDETNQTYMPGLYFHIYFTWDARKAAGYANTNQGAGSSSGSGANSADPTKEAQIVTE